MHDAHAEDPSIAFALSRLADPKTLRDTPIGHLPRRSQRPQLRPAGERARSATAVADQGQGDLGRLLAGNDTWVIAVTDALPWPVATTGWRSALDPDRVDLDRIVRWLAEESYWAAGRPRDVVERSVAGSLNLGVHAAGRGRRDEHVALARVVTDGATFAWICDVFVDQAWRGRGIGSWLTRELRHRADGPSRDPAPPAGDAGRARRVRQAGFEPLEGAVALDGDRPRPNGRSAVLAAGGARHPDQPLRAIRRRVGSPGPRLRSGVLLGVGAYLLWGLFPLYFPLLEPAGADGDPRPTGSSGRWSCLVRGAAQSGAAGPGCVPIVPTGGGCSSLAVALSSSR